MSVGGVGLGGPRERWPAALGHQHLRDRAAVYFLVVVLEAFVGGVSGVGGVLFAAAAGVFDAFRVRHCIKEKL